MELVLSKITENWQTIVEYLLMFVAYFLVFLYKNKVNITKDNLTVAFKENMSVISKTDKTLREDIHKELEESKLKYNEAVSKISSLENMVHILKDTIKALIGETYESTNETIDKDTSSDE